MVQTSENGIIPKCLKTPETQNQNSLSQSSENSVNPKTPKTPEGKKIVSSNLNEMPVESNVLNCTEVKFTIVKQTK
jgi:hypothetical protein